MQRIRRSTTADVSHYTCSVALRRARCCSVRQDHIPQVPPNSVRFTVRSAARSASISFDLPAWAVSYDQIDMLSRSRMGPPIFPCPLQGSSLWGERSVRRRSALNGTTRPKSTRNRKKNAPWHTLNTPETQEPHCQFTRSLHA